MKKFFQIILGISFLFLLVGCSSRGLRLSLKKAGSTELILVYTYDKKNDTVTKFKVEMKSSTENTRARKENEKLSGEIKKDGVVVSVTEKDGKIISTVEIDLTKYKLSEIKESNNVLLAGFLQSGFLIEDGDHVSFSKSKEDALKRGMTEQTK